MGFWGFGDTSHVTRHTSHLVSHAICSRRQEAALRAESAAAYDAFNADGKPRDRNGG